MLPWMIMYMEKNPLNFYQKDSSFEALVVSCTKGVQTIC